MPAPQASGKRCSARAVQGHVSLLPRDTRTGTSIATVPWPVSSVRAPAVPWVWWSPMTSDLVLDLLASGESVAAILDDYPDIEEADIPACVACGAEMAREL